MRDTRKNFDYFKDYLDYQYSRIDKKTAKLKDSDEEKKQRILVSLTGYEVDLLKAEFSIGTSKDNMKNYTNKAIGIVKYYNNITYYDLLTLLSIAVMVNDNSEVISLIKNNEDIIEKDRLLKYIANYIQDKEPKWDNNIQLRSEFSGLDKVFSTSNKETALLEYLDGWYKNHSEYSWYDSHKSNTDTYSGYWSFEAAAISIILGLDESKLRESVYYPSF